MEIVEMQEVCRVFSGRRVLNKLQLSLQQGEFLSIIGKSGSGKSTLINIIGLLDSNFTGTYRFLGRDVSQCTGVELSNIRNQKIGFVFQMYQLIHAYTVKENILLPALYGKNREVSISYYHTLLEQLHISHLEHQLAVNLSGGEKQRVAIARAAINSPALIIADEPTGNLDIENAEKVIRMFRSLQENGVSIIMVTHDPKIAAQADLILKLEDGVLKCE